jgi:hypothetical protein
MTKSEKRKHCAGCYNDEYNYGLGGSHECWSLDSMKLIKRKKVGINDVPPWTWKAKKYPACYRKTGYVFINCEKGDRIN